MANCYKCAHAKAIARLRKICLACNIGQPSCGLSNGGRSHVSLDAAENPDTVLTKGGVDPLYAKPGEKVEPPKIKTDLQGEERNNLLRILYKFADLTWDNAGLVCAMLSGKTLDEIAKERKRKPQTINSRWKRLIKSDPVWEALKNGMIGSGRGRKPDQKPFTQLEFDL